MRGLQRTAGSAPARSALRLAGLSTLLLLVAFVASACGSDDGPGSFAPADGDGAAAGDGGTLDVSERDAAAPPLGEPEWRLVPESALNAGAEDAWLNIHGVAVGPREWLVAVVGTNGSVALYDSAEDEWSHRNAGVALDISAVWVESADEMLIAGGGGELRRWDPSVGERGDWLIQTVVQIPDTVAYLDAWGNREDGQWVVGERGVVVKWDEAAGSWDAQLLPNNGLTGGTKLEAIWGASPADVYAVGNRLILHWNGVEWTKMDTEHRLHGIWGLRDGPFYASGELGVVLTLDRATGEWSEVQPGLPIAYWSVFGTSGEHVIVGGINSYVAQLGAAGWQPEIIEARAGASGDEQIPPNLRFVGIWGLGPDNLYLVSNGPTVVQRGRFAITTP